MRLTLRLTFLLLLALPATAQAATTWTIRGAGFGHGIGLSQYGSYGLAQEGKDYKAILAHYYRGTELSSAPSKPVRVLLQASHGFVRFRGATRGPGGRTLNPRRTYTARRSGNGVAISGVGRFRAPARVSSGRAIRLLGRAINGRTGGRYRGAIELRPGSAGGVTAVNSLAIDPYVQGVIAGEMPSSWDLEALKAQAVAARTYALATAKQGGVFDQYPDTRSQVYYGVSSETKATNRAVRETSAEVLRHEGEIAVTYFFSTSGGRTENVEYSFIGAEPKPWLKSVADPFDKISPKHRWRLRFSTARLGARLGARGTLRSVKVIQRGRSPRIVRARIRGSRGTRTLTGPQIRARLGLYDTWAHFTRVSTSQARRARMARTGRTLPRIEGVFTPAPRRRLLSIQRRAGRRWVKVAAVRASRSGRYRASLPTRGLYRVRAGSIAGPAIRVR